MNEQKVHAIILKRIPYQNEKKSLYSIYTREFGKLLVSGYTSENIASLQRIISPLNVCELVLTHRHDGKYVIKSMSLLDSFYPASDEGMTQLQHTFFICELIHTIVPEDSQDSHELYDMIYHGLRNARESKKDAVYFAIIFKMLDILGYIPHYGHCGNCQTLCDETNATTYGICHSQLSLVCGSCRQMQTNSNYYIIPFHIIKAIRYLQKAPFDFIKKIILHEKDIPVLGELIIVYKNAITNSVFHSEKASLLSTY